MNFFFFYSEGYSGLPYGIYQVYTTVFTATEKSLQLCQGEILNKRATYFLHEVGMDNYDLHEIIHFLNNNKNVLQL